MRGRDYERYLKSPQWQAKRERWFATHGKWCRGCGKRTGPLHLHHLSYEHFGREPLGDLVSVCPKCHRDLEKLHYQMGKRTHRRVVFQAFKAANLRRR